MANEAKGRDSIIPTVMLVLTASASIFIGSLVLGPGLGFVVLMCAASLGAILLFAFVLVRSSRPES